MRDRVRLAIIEKKLNFLRLDGPKIYQVVVGGYQQPTKSSTVDLYPVCTLQYDLVLLIRDELV